VGKKKNCGPSLEKNLTKKDGRKMAQTCQRFKEVTQGTGDKSWTVKTLFEKSRRGVRENVLMPKRKREQTNCGAWTDRTTVHVRRRNRVRKAKKQGRTLGVKTEKV